MKVSTREKKTTNGPFEKRLRKRLNRRALKCTICPPNKGCNSKRHGKHGAQKPKRKDHR